MTRKTTDQRFMDLCREAANGWSTCPREAVGAVVARGGEIVKPGWNGAPSGQPHCTDVGCIMVGGHCIGGQHAEDNALWYAGRDACEGATLYVSHFPCWRCALAIVRARIARVVYEKAYRVDERALKLLYSTCSLEQFVDGRARLARILDVVE